MEIVKKNLLSIICGVVALVAIIALFWPVGGMYDDEKKVLDARVAADNDIRNLVNAQRFWPVVPDLQSGDKAALKRFPNDAVIDAGVAIRNEVHRQALEMRDKTVGDNERQHPLLVPGSLPNPKDLRFTFHTAYLSMVQDSTATDGSKIISRFKAALQGIVPPTDQDVIEAANKLWISDFQPKILLLGGKQVNFEQVSADWQKACLGLQNSVRLSVAQSGKIYLEPDWISMQKAMLDGSKSPAESDIWFAQNMLWVQGDIIEAISRINAVGKDVQGSPVKHVIRIDVADDASMYLQNPTAAVGTAQPQAQPTDAPATFFAVSPTGRVCNPLYDVIQFQLVMNVEASKIDVILAELQRGKLITVHQTDMSAVDGLAAADAGYIYGDVPVTKLTIRGEELFLRDWTTKYMPAQIMALLGVTPPAPSATPPGTTASAATALH